MLGKIFTVCMLLFVACKPIARQEAVSEDKWARTMKRFVQSWADLLAEQRAVVSPIVKGVRSQTEAWPLQAQLEAVDASVTYMRNSFTSNYIKELDNLSLSQRVSPEDIKQLSKEADSQYQAWAGETLASLRQALDANYFYRPERYDLEVNGGYFGPKRMSSLVDRAEELMRRIEEPLGLTKYTSDAVYDVDVASFVKKMRDTLDANDSSRHIDFDNFFDGWEHANDADKVERVVMSFFPRPDNINMGHVHKHIAHALTVIDDEQAFAKALTSILQEAERSGREQFVQAARILNSATQQQLPLDAQLKLAERSKALYDRFFKWNDDVAADIDKTVSTYYYSLDVKPSDFFYKATGYRKKVSDFKDTLTIELSDAMLELDFLSRSARPR